MIPPSRETRVENSTKILARTIRRIAVVASSRSVFPDWGAMVSLFPPKLSSVRAHPIDLLQRGLALIPFTYFIGDSLGLMKANLAQLVRNRRQLVSALSNVRQHSMRASHCGDYRTVAKLTIEAARINSAIADVDVAELSAL
jgi:hypothetical protein